MSNQLIWHFYLWILKNAKISTWWLIGHEEEEMAQQCRWGRRWRNQSWGGIWHWRGMREPGLSVQIWSPRKGEGKKRSHVSPSSTDNAGLPCLISMRKATCGIDILWHRVPNADLNARLKEEGRNKLCFAKRAGAAKEAHGKPIVQRGETGREDPCSSTQRNACWRSVGGGQRGVLMHLYRLWVSAGLKWKLLTRMPMEGCFWVRERWAELFSSYA